VELTCQICGQKVTIAEWTEEYERLKSHPDTPYICPSCQEKIRREANRETQR